MIGWLTVSLEAAAIAAVAGMLASGLLLPALRWTRVIRSAAQRADAAFLLGLLPALFTASLWVALLLPSVLHVAGIRVDHCALHDHHAHLCAVHATGPGIPLIALGALALGLAVLRGGRLACVQARSMRLVRELESLGIARAGAPFPIVKIPGSPWLCLATGMWRRRVLVSAAIVRELEPAEVRAALAHEQAHLVRDDPFLKIILAWAALFSTPSAAAAAQRTFADAAEEASDARAAEAVGAIQVAASLVSMARLTRSNAPATCLAFGGCSLERRVSALLRGGLQARPSRAGFLVAAAASAVAVCAVLGADKIHHTVEMLLFG